MNIPPGGGDVLIIRDTLGVFDDVSTYITKGEGGWPKCHQKRELARNYTRDHVQDELTFQSSLVWKLMVSEPPMVLGKVSIPSYDHSFLSFLLFFLLFSFFLESFSNFLNLIVQTKKTDFCLLRLSRLLNLSRAFFSRRECKET